jgi:hypothetical protein
MSQRRRALLCVGALIALAVVGRLAVPLLVPRSPVNRENFERIVPGMGEAEVVTILGRPTGKAHAGSSFFDVAWVGDDAVIDVSFNPDGRVIVAQVMPPHMSLYYNPPILERISGWLGL